MGGDAKYRRTALCNREAAAHSRSCLAAAEASSRQGRRSTLQRKGRCQDEIRRHHRCTLVADTTTHLIIVHISCRLPHPSHRVLKWRDANSAATFAPLSGVGDTSDDRHHLPPRITASFLKRLLTRGISGSLEGENERDPCVMRVERKPPCLEAALVQPSA